MQELLQKLQRVQNKVQKIPRNGYNSYSGYSYPYYEDIMSVLQPVLQEENLFLTYDCVSGSSRRTEDGKKQQSEVELMARVYDCDSGYSLSSSCFGYSEDSGDKAPWKAHTNARKYATIALFGLQVGEDAESSPDPSEESRKKTASSAAARKTKQQRVI